MSRLVGQVNIETLPQLMVSFAADRKGKTFLRSQRAAHPYHLCRPLYRPGDPLGLATLYIQGCAGGIFEDDRLALAIGIDRGAAAHVTSGAATLVHRMPNGGHAEQEVRLTLAPAALLEYFPDPSILFPRSRLRALLSVRHTAGAQLIAVDSFLGHRLPDDDAPFDWLDSTLRIEDEQGRLLARERFVAQGQAWRDANAGISAGMACQGTVLVLGAGAAPLLPLRAALDGLPGVLGGASVLPNEVGVLARVLATDGVALRSALQAGWQAARGALGIPLGQARPK